MQLLHPAGGPSLPPLRARDRTRDERRRARSLALTRIEFRRWGKLEGQGRIALRPRSSAQRLEQLDRINDRLLAAALPAFAGDKLAWRLNGAKRAVGGRGESLRGADVFIAEAWHDGTEPWPFTLSIMTQEKKASGLFQAAMFLAPGYNRLLYPVGDIAKLVDIDAPLTIQIEPLREGAPPIVFGLLDFAVLARNLDATSASRPAPAKAEAGKEKPKFKCVVWDLDNTLWKGALVEDGVEGIVPFPAALAAIRELDRRGIINSIASKNDSDLAFAALAKFGVRDYFVFPKIGWGPKSEALQAIIAEMDVGADTFAFVDDEAFDRGEIEQLVPDITVFDAREIDRLIADPRCDVPITAESAKRREMYQSEERRIVARDNSGVDYGVFLRSCRIKLDVARLERATLLRMYELSQRTNQLNFSGLRYSQAELETLMAERPADTFVLTCSDKFGDYGAIGFCVLAADRPRVQSFFMSCRVQRKRVENAFFQLLRQELLARGARRLEIQYKATAKSKASVQMLTELGFALEAEDDGTGLFVRRLQADFADSDVVELRAAWATARMEAVA
ncbi:MAG TPA: HAD-IIIC family phosphatase [Stellaceae bacterium]|nr:HAD-IIIC family phosphatase [Stellaceae bacterium]